MCLNINIIEKLLYNIKLKICYKKNKLKINTTKYEIKMKFVAIGIFV